MAELGEELRLALAARLQGASDPEQEVRVLVRELNAMGHELFSWDESEGDFQVWGYDYTNPPADFRMVIDFRYGADGDPHDVHLSCFAPDGGSEP